MTWGSIRCRLNPYAKRGKSEPSWITFMNLATFALWRKLFFQLLGNDRFQVQGLRSVPDLIQRSHGGVSACRSTTVPLRDTPQRRLSSTVVYSTEQNLSSRAPFIAAVAAGVAVGFGSGRLSFFSRTRTREMQRTDYSERCAYSAVRPSKVGGEGGGLAS